MQDPADLFVGREDELKLFRKMLAGESSTRILNIHGEAGIGKTHLLKRMQKLCADEFPDKVVVANEIIDFYDIESRSRLGVMRQIVANLGDHHFIQFGNTGKESAFQREYSTLAIAAQGKQIVLFFDSYEYIQRIGTIANEHERTTVNWIETELFHQIESNTIIVLAGIEQIKEIDMLKFGESLEKRALRDFSHDEAESFLQKCFNNSIFLGVKDRSKTLCNFTSGNPLLLSLVARVICGSYSKEPQKFFQVLEKKYTDEQKESKSFKEPTKEAFKQVLRNYYCDIENPINSAITYMVIGHRRMNVDLFCFMTGRTQDYLLKHLLAERLKTLPFIKWKKNGEFLIQDIICDLIINSSFNPSLGQDRDRSQRKSIVNYIITYYKKKFLEDEGLSEEAREVYAAELMEYKLFVLSPTDTKGLDYFCREFETALQNKKYVYCRLLLNSAQNYSAQDPQPIPFLAESVAILKEWLTYQMATYNELEQIEKQIRELSEKIRELSEKCKDKELWENSRIKQYLAQIQDEIAPQQQERETMETAKQSRPTTVFISYSHDSEEHESRVLALANRLRKDGLDCNLDQYDPDPTEGWPRWMIKEIDKADKVLMICTKTYYNRSMDKERPDVGKGVKLERLLITEDIYQEDANNPKFIPALFTEEDKRHIPRLFGGNAYYVVASQEGYDKLYWRLTDQHKIKKPPVGQVRKRSLNEPTELFPDPAFPEPTEPTATGPSIPQQIVEVVQSIPNIGQPETQQMLLTAAELDQELENQIRVGLPGAQFAQLLVATAKAYGTLANHQPALVAILRAAKKYVNPGRREFCDRLIRRLS
jgi:uncharacterized membrane protein (DUF106 family)